MAITEILTLAWPLSGNEAESDCFDTESTLASLPLKRQVTKQRIVKCAILENKSPVCVIL